MSSLEVLIPDTLGEWSKEDRATYMNLLNDALKLQKRIRMDQVELAALLEGARLIREQYQRKT